ncbi:MAG: replication initiator protein A [Firmicutes bacterium]|nr:replication initiator protein A [Bacillota bacterium]
MSFDYFYGPQAEQFSFFRIPKVLFTDKQFENISTDAKVLYGMMLDRVSLSVKNDWLDEEGRVYIIFTLQEIMEEMNCGDQKATKLQVELEKKCGLIERKRQGQGKPTLIYVKNFISCVPESRIKNRENHESGFQTRENHESRIVKNGSPDSRKSRANNTDNNKTDSNDTDPILSSGGEEPETEWKGTEPRNEIKDLFERNLQGDALRKSRPKEAGLINEIIELLVDTFCSRKKLIRITRDDKPADDVRQKLLMLDASHIEYVLTCMAQNTTQVVNMRQYLLATLYNAPMTIENYYSAQAQHDIDAGKI